MALDKKVKSIFRLMELLVERKIVKANDEKLAEELGYTTKTLGRHLEDLSMMYPNIISINRGKNRVYEFADVSYVFEKIMTTSNDFYWFFDLVDRWDSSIFQDMNYKVSQKERDIFLYKNSPFEEFDSEKKKEIFRSLKSAIISKKQIDIHYIYDEPRVHKQAIPLKLIFMERNWYVAIVDSEIGCRFLRVFFIEEVKNISIGCYIDEIEEEELKKYYEFLKYFENPMSRCDKPKKIAHLLATVEIAKYFKPHMKKHFLSEKFLKENPDGSVEFTVEYTQSIEILPFIKKWLPYLKILSPHELDETLRKQLSFYLN